jgi:hypothetical protein
VIPCPETAREREVSKEELPVEDPIRLRAYDLYGLRSNQSGSELDDWPQAEEEIRRVEEEVLDES